MSDPLPLFAACLPGLEPLLAAELSALGVAAPAAVPGGVAFDGAARLAADVLVGSGIASHLWVRVASFRARHVAELRDRAGRDIDWARWLSPGTPLEVRATSRRSKLYHTGAIVERVAAAWREALGDPQREPASGDPVLHVRFENDVAEVSLDLAGEPLHRRGWRLEVAKAPLREDLAWAAVRAAGWQPDTPFVDPFCGSGTLAISAALLARGRAPGLGRSFAAERSLAVPPADLAAAREAAAARAGSADAGTAGGAADRAAGAPIIAVDRDAGAIDAARRNAIRAGVGDAVAFTVGNWRDALDGVGDGPPGAIVTNPPFGKRVGSGAGARLEHLWQAIGHRLTGLPAGWRVAILAADRRLALRTGLGLRTAFLTRHGGMPVRLMCGETGSAERPERDPVG